MSNSILLITSIPTDNLDGKLCFVNSRIPLTTVITRYKQGDTPEQIQAGFDTLTLAQIYATIAHYLANTERWEKRLADEQAEGQAVYDKIEANRPDMLTLQQKLVERKKGKL